MTCRYLSESAFSSRFQLAMYGVGITAGNRHRNGQDDENRAKQQSRRIHQASPPSASALVMSESSMPLAMPAIRVSRRNTAPAQKALK